MIYKLGTASDLEKLASVDPLVKETVLKNLVILDENYGVARDIDKDDGGYVLYVDFKASPDEVKVCFDHKQYKPEYIDYIDSDPPYCVSLFLVSNDFGVVLIAPLNYTLKEICQNDVQD